MSMTKRFAARPTKVSRRSAASGLASLAALAAFGVLTPKASAKQARPAPSKEATAPGRRADYGDRLDQVAAGDLVRRRGMDPARAGLDRHDGARDAGRHLRGRRQGERPPLDHVR